MTSGHALATEIADFLVRESVPFAVAHEVSGKAVALAESLGIEVHELSDEQLASVDSRLSLALRASLSGEAAVESRESISGTSTKSVVAQISHLEGKIRGYSAWIASEQKRFSGMMAL